jgi:GNAT superfamily N-acetyltransferase
VSASDCPIPGAQLRRLTPVDAGQVTVLQRCCWVEEALTNEDWWIPALRETVDEVAQWLGELEAWGLWVDGRLVAMVRAGRTEHTWDIGRLAVVPDLRGHHLGDWLLDHIESRAD